MFVSWDSMGRRLQKIPFSSELQPLVLDFYCGDEPWETEVADWIKSTDPIKDMQRGTDVWLYVSEEAEVVGFGSLGLSRWNWPLPQDPRVQISLIPMVGIQKRFWGQPEGNPADRYSAQILDDLIFEATTHKERYPLLGLFVHSENKRAIRVYEKANFQRFSKTYTDPATGITYISMILRLPQ